MAIVGNCLAEEPASGELIVSFLVGVLYADHLAGRPIGPGWARTVVGDLIAGPCRPRGAPPTP